ncbi:MAG: hypothetical protein F9K29_12470 [Hyphomicrobiaceae bacterium]|nr:MAG: hypothetical protein F9K29_12470 [Hyphomicrobiaceae bacterium]
MAKTLEQILTEKLAQKELEIARLVSRNEELAEQLEATDSEIRGLRARQVQEALRIDGEGDEENGAAWRH